MRIGLYGGTFNPITTAHIAVAKHALKGLDAVWLMPSFDVNWKSNDDLASPVDRLAMCEIAVARIPGLCVFPYEIVNRIMGGTYNVITHMHRHGWSIKNSLELYFILGKDSADSMQTWNFNEELRDAIRFIVYPREGSNSSIVGNEWYNYPPHSYVTDFEAPDISSTEVRRWLRNGFDTSSIYWSLSHEVRKYINEMGLYK